MASKTSSDLFISQYFYSASKWFCINFVIQWLWLSYFYTQYNYFVLLIILQESLLKPNTSNIDADKLFLIILTSLNRFLALYHLCASVLKGFLPDFFSNLRGINLGTFCPSQSSFTDLAAYTTLQWFCLVCTYHLFLPACLWEKPTNVPRTECECQLRWLIKTTGGPVHVWKGFRVYR